VHCWFRNRAILTSAELRDEELLPHMERPNPHKKTYNNMMLYLRYQVEEYAFKKWGGPEGLDAEYFRRDSAKKERKEKKFLDKLKEMRKKTRAEALTRKADIGHKHEWSAPVKDADGTATRKCAFCGMITEEILF
jgi:DNA-repair protein complementing XP-A cells